MDDIQKITENAYDAVREAEEPTCCQCHAFIGLTVHTKQLSTPHGCALYSAYEFGCRQCGRLGRGGTPWLAIVDYIKRYEINQ